MSLPVDYLERVYAGVLGKMIGVYLGRPFEGWTYEKIMVELGEIQYYVHDQLNLPLIVTDDDLAGTFTFLRALPDNGNSLELSPEQIGKTWLNYLIENRTVLWWGGMGSSTEHTAYLRLKSGIPAPQSGSNALNGPVVSEQIGSQIFIDGWAMVTPGDPEKAADLARKAASVSHDGEAIYGAQLLAAMEAQAFVEKDLNKLIDIGLSFIPQDSMISSLVSEIRGWHAADQNWRATFRRIQGKYGYDSFPGNCHIVPNHALIHLALLYGGDNFHKALSIVNTCGWDTDCNSGNVGCLLGIKNGLAGLSGGPDWRGPVADRLYIPTADGGRAITDAVRETYSIVNIGRALEGQPPLAPKGGARFHFELPGSVQGFHCDYEGDEICTIELVNEVGHSKKGKRSLAVHYEGLTGNSPGYVATYTFIPDKEINYSSYDLISSPTLYSGQIIEAGVFVDEDNRTDVEGGLYIKYYGEQDQLMRLEGPQTNLEPGAHYRFFWTVPDLNGMPIQSVGICMRGQDEASGTNYLDYLTWHGSPKLLLTKPDVENSMWRRAWVDAVDNWNVYSPRSFEIVKNDGVGLLLHGTQEWTDYRVKAKLASFMAKSFGLAVRAQGLKRYYAMLICDDGKARLIKSRYEVQVLKEVDIAYEINLPYDLELKVEGQHLQGRINGDIIFDLVDDEMPLEAGSAALIVEEGVLYTDQFEINL